MYRFLDIDIDIDIDINLFRWYAWELFCKYTETKGSLNIDEISNNVAIFSFLF